jgi:hypothetical protein
MAHFDMELVDKLVGENVGQLSFGGAAFNESMDLLEYALSTNENIHTVYFGVSFYTLNENYYKDRMSQIKLTAKNPLAYMLNFNYNIEMLNEIPYFLRGEKNVSLENIGNWPESDYLNADGTRRKYRKNLEEYAATIFSVCENYAYDEKDVERYIELLKFCKDKNITVYTVLPPMDTSIKDLVVDKLDIGKYIEDFINKADEYSVVLNYEYNEENIFSEEKFYDGFHLDGKNGLPVFTEMLFKR